MRHLFITTILSLLLFATPLTLTASTSLTPPLSDLSLYQEIVEIAGEIVEKATTYVDNHKSGRVLGATTTWQNTLLQWHQSFQESDFDVELAPLSTTEVASLTDEEAWLWRTVFSDANRLRSKIDGITMQSSNYLYSTLYPSVDQRLGDPDEFMPMGAAYWACVFNYPGNSYYGNDAVKRRVLVASAHFLRVNPTNVMYLEGGVLTHMAFTYYHCKDFLNDRPDVQQAFEEGLEVHVRHVAANHEGWDYDPGGSDLAMFVMPGMYYAAAVQSDPQKRSELLSLATEATRSILDDVVVPSGGHLHDDGTDPSYDGIALWLLNWVANLYEDPTITDHVLDMVRVKGTHYLPDEPGTWYSPTSWAAGTSAGYPHDQRVSLSREIGLSYLSDKALWLTNTRVNAWVDRQEINSEIIRGITRMNNAGFGEPADISLTGYGLTGAHWSIAPPMTAFEKYPAGWYATTRSRLESEPELFVPSHNRQVNHIDDLGNEGMVLSMKTDNYSALVHAGFLSQRSSVQAVSGFSGGTLAGFVGDGGIVVMGRSRGQQGKSARADQWDSDNGRDYESWLVEGVHGENSVGPFSTTRFRVPNHWLPIVGIDSSSRVITFRGKLEAGFKPGETFNISQRTKRNINFYYLDPVATFTVVEVDDSSGDTVVTVTEDVSEINTSHYGDVRPSAISIDKQAQTAEVTAVGILDQSAKVGTGKELSAYDNPFGAIRGKISYARTYSLNLEGVTVTSKVFSDGTDQVTKLFESIPLHLKGDSESEPAAVVEVSTDNGSSWHAPSTTYEDGVTHVRRTRYGQSDYIVFSSPVRLKKHDEEWSTTYQSKTTGLVLHVDLHPTGDGLPRTFTKRSLRYSVQTSLSSSPDTLQPQNQQPQSSFATQTNNLTATFTDTSTDSDGTLTSYSWTFGDGNTSTDSDPEHTYDNAGTHTVTLTITDNDGAMDTASEEVTVTTPSNPTPDSDSDGIQNALDRCPNTPQNRQVNTRGCPTPRAANFDIKPNFTNRNLSSIQNVEFGRSGIGKISFGNRQLRLHKGNGDRLDLDTHLEITNARVSLNSTNLPELDHPAIITLYNLTVDTPRVMRDGNECTNCTIQSYEDGTLTFTVPGFSTYTVEEGEEEKGNDGGSGDSSNDDDDSSSGSGAQGQLFGTSDDTPSFLGGDESVGGTTDGTANLTQRQVILRALRDALNQLVQLYTELLIRRMG